MKIILKNYEKIIFNFFYFFLIIVTTVTKNSTKKLESQIFKIRENISILKNKYELVLLDYNYLTTPKKLMEYQSKYFENNLIPLDVNKIKKIKQKNNELIIIESNKNKLNNE